MTVPSTRLAFSSSRNASCALQREAMTGVPQASASISGRPQPSPRVGET